MAAHPKSAKIGTVQRIHNDYTRLILQAFRLICNTSLGGIYLNQNVYSPLNHCKNKPSGAVCRFAFILNQNIYRCMQGEKLAMQIGVISYLNPRSRSLPSPLFPRRPFFSHGDKTSQGCAALRCSHYTLVHDRTFPPQYKSM